MDTIIPITKEEENELKIQKVKLEDFKHLVVKHNRAMVLPIEKDYSTSGGGIVLQSELSPVTFKHGVIVGLGEGAYLQDGKLLKPDVELGDFIYFSDMHGTDYKVLMEDGRFEDVKIVDIPSIQFVDGLAKGRDYKIV